ncbi:heavy metal translocating P-type ATPase [Palleronia pelagia]|uniref:Cu2+-exporting ATPase n=1 Tax=Palleronia pelagia TaxID=387096 RepID=A0A1H8KME0_9RHOB|nr:heavy metal translocating P-type ATPase [Palleronia pelagia]SEN94113.1 Cu2+-exporting ATPase [Palleronia pelagia]
MSVAACPACAGAVPGPRAATPDATHLLHLPDIHCGGCISSVERALTALPDVLSARVNLTQKRVSVAAPGLPSQVLIDALARAGHRAQPLDRGRLGPRDVELRRLLTRIGVAGFAMMNVMLMSVAVWSGATGATAQVFHLVSAMIAIPAVAYAAQPFFGSALSALRAGRLNMDVPISLAIVLASGASLAQAFGLSDRAGWFDAALALTFFLLVGRYLERAGRGAARSAAAELAALEAPQALLVTGDGTRVVAADSLVPGDRIRLLPGDRLPADGTILSGATDLDRSALTGESAPAPAGIGDAVQAGEIALTGSVEVRVDRAGRDTALSRMAEIVATAEAQRTRYAGIADRAARLYAPLVHGLGAATFGGWLLVTGDAWLSLDVAISVLVITCPCALGLAVPVVSTVATGRLFRDGILVKSDTALERLSQIDTVAFDKTGTLTTGEVRLATELGDDDLALAAGLARHSRHPLARAIVAAADARDIAPAQVDGLTEHPGLGLEATHGTRRIRLGRPGWAGPDSDGPSAFLDTGDGAPRPLDTAERIAPETEATVTALRARGMDMALLSGDGPRAVARIAGALGIAAAQARLTPEGKVDWIADRRAAGHRVLMVGDGLNDTGGLAVADAAISPGSGLDAARSAADVVLLRGGLGGVTDALWTARAAMARMRQNIGLAVAYNVVSVPLAVLGYASPLVAALAMSLSSITVTLNAVRRFK